MAPKSNAFLMNLFSFNRMTKHFFPIFYQNTFFHGSGNLEKFFYGQF
jgi:hypothetical protein